MYIPVAPPYNWSGFYIGGNVGAGWNSTGSITDTFGSTFGTTTNTSFLGGGQVGVNYEFWGGVVIGAEAMFDWVPNTSNTINATERRACSPGDRRGDDQQSMADDRDWQARLCMGSCSALRQGRRRLGRGKQSFDYGQWGTRPRSPAAAATILAGPLVSALNGLLRAIGQREPSGITSGCRTRALRVAGGSSFGGDVISVNNRSINMFTAGLNYKFGGGGGNRSHCEKRHDGGRHDALPQYGCKRPKR